MLVVLPVLSVQLFVLSKLLVESDRNTVSLGGALSLRTLENFCSSKGFSAWGLSTSKEISAMSKARGLCDKVLLFSLESSKLFMLLKCRCCLGLFFRKLGSR